VTRALVALVVASCQASPAIDERAAAIVGGTIDLADEAVVALSPRTRPCGADPDAACTGALIAPRAVLTAAHCVANESPSTLLVTIGPRVANGERVEIEAIEVHPGYDGVSADLAVLALAAPLAAPPLALRRTPIDNANLGARVRVVGFGVGDDGLTGIKREGTARIAELSATTVVLAPDPALPCNADSGGPVLLGEEIAGVVAYGDPACAASGTSTRVDVHVDTFIAPALARIAASAASSRPPLVADTTACTACERTDDCPRGSECLDGTCALLGSEYTALGATCTDEQACSGTPCVAGLDTACRCMTSCDDDANGCGCHTNGASGGTLPAVVLVAAVLALRRRRSRRSATLSRASARSTDRDLRVSLAG
jgi:MYXO-CTERM domain-containing protein